MWIKIIVLFYIVAAALAADKKKDESRGKRNLHHSVSHHYPAYRLERRISTGSQIPSLYQSQYYPTRFPSPYRKGRPYSAPPPPYAVQMEPLIHYSQRDPLYDTNILSLNTDGLHDDLLTDNNHINENRHGPPKHIIERPIYIKEPEPIIEIIIKESNVSLPAPPSPPPTLPKKKEEVQVFYVKYKKNPNSHGKDSIIYDKPVPAISPQIKEEHEDTVATPQSYQPPVTLPPPPTTTLRTIIHPESETYHGPSGIKVTFGKESFDHKKRQNKPEDLKLAPQGRQLSTFSHQPTNNFNLPPTFRQPQPYRPFSQFRQTFPRHPSEQQYSTLPKFPPPQPPRPQVSQLRQPVPYQPFENFKQSPQIPFRPEEHFSITQAPPLTQKKAIFKDDNNKPSFLQYQQTPFIQPASQYQQNLQKPISDNRPKFVQPSFQLQNSKFNSQVIKQQQPPFNPQVQPQFNQAPINSQLNQQFFANEEKLNILPPGGELIPSLSKYEQHISVQESTQQKQPNNFPLLQPQTTPLTASQQFQPSISFNQNKQQQQFLGSVNFNQEQFQPQSQNQAIYQPHPQQPNHPLQFNNKVQQQFREANTFQKAIPSQQQYNFQHSQQLFSTTQKPVSFLSSTQRISTTTTQATTTSTTASTTTKDPKVLSAQLPDEVPDELREQLLSSGILNNAQISILDYDKVGDIPISALPPDQLANFYGAGGAQQIAAEGSAPIPAVISRTRESVELESESSKIHEITAKPQVEMKVVHYDPQTDKGQQVQETYLKEDATQVDPVELNGEKYNRYLPLKVSGAQFPIPDVPELKGKEISSVVILAPVSYDFSSKRKVRTVKDDDIELIEGQILKTLLKEPSEENFRKFFEKEKQTSADKQAVILLVTGSDAASKEREIFMYDVASKTVSKLDGELSSAFVDAAEANSAKDSKTSASEIVEMRVPYEVPTIESHKDLEQQASDHFNSFIESPVDIAASETKLRNHISVYSKIKTAT